MKPMDRNATVGLFGTLASWGLAEYQLIFAIIASLLTIVWMGICIYKFFDSKK